MRFYLFSFATLMFLSGASISSAVPPKEISIIELIAHPKQNEGRRVMLAGFLHLEFEGDALYLHADDFKFGIHKNSIWVDIPEDLRVIANKYNNRYVYIVGYYTAKRNGHGGLSSGELNRITRIELQEPRTSPAVIVQ
jgi:hypothetical protein